MIENKSISISSERILKNLKQHQNELLWRGVDEMYEWMSEFSLIWLSWV